MHGSELRARRRRLGLSQAALGRAIGVPTNTIARWEQGAVGVRHPGMLRLALGWLDDDKCRTGDGWTPRPAADADPAP